MNYSVNGKEILIGDNKISFNDEIIKVEDLGKSIILLIKNTSTGDVQKQPLNNIIAIDENANVIWKIVELTNNDEFYPGFSIQQLDDQGSVLVTSDCMGRRYTIRLSDLILLEMKGYRF
jgi:hypothetical protein